MLLPEREDFVCLWRWLERTCAAGRAAGPVRPAGPLRRPSHARAATRSLGRTMVCLQVLDERGLILA